MEEDPIPTKQPPLIEGTKFRWTPDVYCSKCDVGCKIDIEMDDTFPPAEEVHTLTCWSCDEDFQASYEFTPSWMSHP